MFYGPALAALYDNAMGDAAMPTVLAGVERAIRDNAIRAHRIADIGCGTGQLLAALARTGRCLYGVDASAAMLRIARRRLNGTCTTLLRQDMRALTLPASIDLMLCTLATVNYLVRDADLNQAFAVFARNLSGGGHFIFDFIPHAPNASSPTSVRQQLVTPAG